MRIDLREWQDIGELPEFRDNPFLKVESIPTEIRPFIEIVDVSSQGIRVKAKNFVGILPLSEDIALTVSPKAPVKNFLYILSRSQGKGVSPRELEKIISIGRERAEDYSNIFTFLIYVFLEKLNELKRSGFLKTSEYAKEDKVVRGKVLVRETINSWMNGRSSQVVCGIYELTRNNPENRLIKFVLWMFFSKFSKFLDSRIRDSLFEKYRWFSDVPLNLEVGLVEEVEEAIAYRTLPNSRSYYYDILNLCIFFLTSSTFDIKSAKEVKIRSFVVDMNKVFESYVFQVLSGGLKEFDDSYRVERYCKRPLFDNLEGKYEITPDYLILREGKVVAVADAKYEKEPKNDDFYQILTYAERFEVEDAWLIYPSWSGKTYVERFQFKGKRVNLVYFDMLDCDKSERELIESFVEKIIERRQSNAI